jgi:hypothetical protein
MSSIKDVKWEFLPYDWSGLARATCGLMRDQIDALQIRKLELLDEIETITEWNAQRCVNRGSSTFRNRVVAVAKQRIEISRLNRQMDLLRAEIAKVERIYSASPGALG